MSSTVGNEIPNPMRSISIPPELLANNAEKRIRAFESFAFITTKHHTTLPLSIHNYTHPSFWSNSPLSVYSPQQQQWIMDSQTLISGQNEASLALTLASRSLVTERDTGRVISRSFAKFFNHYEKMAYKPTGCEESYEIQEKVDGSIISLFWYDGLQSSSGSSPKSPNRGQWVVASRTCFSSPQTESALKILKTQFSSLLNDTQDSPLDKSKTYVFELVDNHMPIKIRYPYGLEGLVLLSIIGNDGSETRLGNTGLPFRRPRIWKLEELITGENGVGVTASNLKQLSKLQRADEEGFVITFWRTKHDVYPQRVKVKLESYLKLCKPGTTINLSSRTSKSSGSRTKILVNGPPSPRTLLDIYTSYRMSVSSFNKTDACMASAKKGLIEAIQGLNVLDDYGGETWLAMITGMWDRIHALFLMQEMNWKDMVKKLEEEGYRSGPQGKNSASLRQNFNRRIQARDMDRSLAPSLKAWFEGQGIQEIVKVVVESVEFPNDLKSTEVIVLE